MTATTSATNSERNIRKRLAARARQQRCRARKREAKLAAKASNELMMKDGRRSIPAVRRPVLITTAPPSQQRLGIPILHHHPTSPFVVYPRRASPFPSAAASHHHHHHHRPHPHPHPPVHPIHYWPVNNNSPLMTTPSACYHPTTSCNTVGGVRPRPHKEIMARSSMALAAEICRTPTSPPYHSPLRSNLPRVSPVGVESCAQAKAPIMLPELDRLERNEETAIDAMLSLFRGD